MITNPRSLPEAAVELLAQPASVSGWWWGAASPPLLRGLFLFLVEGLGPKSIMRRDCLIDYK